MPVRIPFVRLDGKMSAKRREEAITRFSVPLVARKAPVHKLTSPTKILSGRPRRTSRKKGTIEEIDDSGDNSDDDFTMGTSEADYSDFEDDQVEKNDKGKGKSRQVYSEEDDFGDVAFTTDDNPAVMLLSLKAVCVTFRVQEFVY